MRARGVVAGAILLAGSLGVAVSALAQAPAFDPIKTRQAGQLLVFGSFTGMRQAVVHKLPVKPFVEPAMAISRWMDQYPTLFPPGSDKGDNTKALPAIWKNFATFQKDAANASAAASKLAMLAKADNGPGFAAQLKVLGGACGTCHKSFRAK
jgi:cytochrome c556